MIMRWIFSIFLVSTGIYLLKGNSTRHLAIRRIFFVFFIVAGISSIIFENKWTTISQLLGVESGTALLTYLVTFSFIGATISNYRWRKEQEERIVELARQLTLNIDNKNNNFD